MSDAVEILGIVAICCVGCTGSSGGRSLSEQAMVVEGPKEKQTIQLVVCAYGRDGTTLLLLRLQGFLLRIRSTLTATATCHGKYLRT